MRKLIAILPVLALALASCDDAQKKAEDVAAEQYAKAMGVDADVSTNADGSKNVTVNHGGTTVSTGNNVSVPSDFPRDFPVYPGVRIAAASSMPGQGFLVQGVSKDKMDVIGNFYASRMKAEGWTNAGTVQMPEMHALQFEKAGRSATVTLTKDNEGTLVQLVAPPG